MRVDGLAGQLGYRLAEGPLSDLQLRLAALKERGRIRTRVCPVVVVRSGGRGELFLGRRHYFVFQRPTYSERRGGQEVTLESTDVGSRIEVQPWTGDGQNITAKVWLQANTVLTVDSQGLPRVATRTARGTVRLTSSDTVIFGGLNLESQSGRRGRAGKWPAISDLARFRWRLRNGTRGLVLLSARASASAADFGTDLGPARKVAYRR